MFAKYLAESCVVCKREACMYERKHAWRKHALHGQMSADDSTGKLLGNTASRDWVESQKAEGSRRRSQEIAGGRRMSQEVVYEGPEGGGQRTSIKWWCRERWPCLPQVPSVMGHAVHAPKVLARSLCDVAPGAYSFSASPVDSCASSRAR